MGLWAMATSTRGGADGTVQGWREGWVIGDGYYEGGALATSHCTAHSKLTCFQCLELNR